MCDSGEGHWGLFCYPKTVGMATVYGMDDRSSWVRFPAEAVNFSLLHSVQARFGAHPASYALSTGGEGLFLWG